MTEKYNFADGWSKKLKIKSEQDGPANSKSSDLVSENAPYRNIIKPQAFLYPYNYYRLYMVDNLFHLIPDF